MKLRIQIVLLNVGIAVGLGIEAALGASKLALLVAAAALYLIANVIFWARTRKSRRAAQQTWDIRDGKTGDS